jgi:hypothetical protein
MYSLRSKLMRINSKERDPLLSGSASNMVVKFDANNPTISQIHSIAFKSCGIPNTVNNVDLTNNSFTFSTGGVLSTIPLLEGNYNIAALINALVTSPQGTAVGMGIIIDPITGRLEFSFTTPSTLLGSGQNKAADLLGLGDTSSAVDIPLYLAPNLPNLIGLKNIYIACNELSGGDYLIDSQLGQLNIFAHVPVSVKFGAIQHYITADIESDMLLFPADRNLDYLTIKLFDDRGVLLDLQGLDYQFIIKIYYHTASTN